MNTNEIDLFKVMYALRYKLDDQQRIYVGREVEQLEKKLRSGGIYNDELILLNVLHRRVNSKISLLNAKITRDRQRLRTTGIVKDTYFTGIDLPRLRRCVAAREFKQPESLGQSVEEAIADEFFERYLKNT